jgi:hypothetical protein
LSILGEYQSFSSLLGETSGWRPGTVPRLRNLSWGR